MGLDTVEIVMRIEEEFSIDLPDAVLGSVRTVGDLYEIVLSKLETTSAPSCLSSKAFYRTRRALVDSLGLPRRSIRPATPLETLLPVQSRHLQWSEIADSIELKFPKLQPTQSQKHLFGTLGVAIPSAIILAAWAVLHVCLGIPVSGFAFWGPATLMWFILLLCASLFLMGLTQGLALQLPVATVGELARMVLTMNFTEFAPTSQGSQPLSREAVWNQIVFIFSDQMQIKAEEIVPEARIAEDLRID